MDENGSIKRPARRSRFRRFRMALGIVVLLLVVFHRPLLQTAGRRVAISFAAKKNVKVDLRVEGSMLGEVVLRNVHAAATGPSVVQSADVDLVRVDYSLWNLLRHGLSGFLENIEVRNASIVLDPKKAPKIEPKKNEKFTLPAIFPDRLTLSDINLRMIAQPRELIVQHLSLDLQPNRPGELRIAQLQIPSGKSWSDVTAQTSYENRNLFLRNLVLDDETKLEVVNLDASKIDQNKLDLKFHGVIAGGEMSGALALGEKKSAMQTNVDFSVKNTSLDRVARYFGQTAPATKGDVRQLEVKGSGLADSPRTWTGSIIGEIDNLVAGGATFDRAHVDVKAANGAAQINHLQLTRGANEITLQGEAELPETFAGFGHKPANIQLRGKLPDLGEVTAGLPQPIRGSAEVNGQIKVADDTVHADIALAGGPIDFGQGTAQKFVVKLNAARTMAAPAKEKVPYYAGLTSEVSVDVSEVRAKEYALDSIHAELRSNGKELNIQQLFVRRMENQLALKGQYELPADFAQAVAQPAVVEFTVTAPNVGDFWVGDSPDKVTGQLQASGLIHYQGQLGDGAFNVYGHNLLARNLTIVELCAQGTTARNVVYLNDFTANLNEHDYVRANGTYALEGEHTYGGSVSARIADLAKLKPILSAAGNKNDLAGSLAVDWHGSGEAKVFKNSGDLKLNLEKGRYANLQALQARVDATYSPDGLEVPIIFFGSDKMFFQANAEAKGNSLEITNIKIDQGAAKYASGYVSVPFIWKNVGSDRAVMDPNGKVAVSFQSENLDIKKLTDDLKMKPVGSGLVSLKIDASGTPKILGAQLEVHARDLKSANVANLEPATFDLTAQVQNNELVVNGALKQSRIQPLAITANLPFNLARIIEERKFDENTPVKGKVQLPRSSVNFLRQFVPALEQLDGDLAIDANVNGTIARPVLSGAGDITINLARFSNATLPALREFKARMVFNDNSLSFERFAGDLAGGPFVLSGRLTFPKLIEPTLDLQLKATSVLVARSDEITARADVDVKVQGPLASANVTGNVALTNSRFLKNIDLIPIGLPGRPAPRPQPPSSQAPLTFPEPPLRDWKFDVAIKTKDPFLLRGNLANGGAIVDLHLGGTGLRPELSGQVRLENVEATLPFSRLQIAHGFLYFDPSDPLNPKMDLQGTSLIRDYTVHVYVYGTARAPEAVFTSEPPLPQEEIISLLATGTTREELLSGNNVLAGRAAMLLVQQLYRKVFKKGEQTNSNSAFDRLDVDVGTVDPRTGQQTATARYKINEKFQLVGDIGVGGDFRGQVKYLIRFR